LTFGLGIIILQGVSRILQGVSRRKSLAGVNIMSPSFPFTEKEKDTEEKKHKKDGMGTFYNQPHYMKLYDVLKGAYSNYKVRT
jgi:hypothetical protein